MKIMNIDLASIPTPIKQVARYLISKFHAIFITPVQLAINNRKNVRWLEIGPNRRKLDGFEAINVVWSPGVNYIGDASKSLPFKSGAFDLIFASHIIEHIAWYQVQHTIRDWVRCLKRGGTLEVWAPDALKICEAWVQFEKEGNSDGMVADGWYRLNDEGEPAKWASGRIYAYGDGKGTLDHPNWHRALFSERYMKLLLRRSGLVDVRKMNISERRGKSHGWIDLGVMGRKP